MKKMILILATATATSLVSAESVLKPLNEKGYGTVSGRIQSLSMYRDFEGATTGANSTLGAVINYTSPEFAGFDAGLGYNYAGEIYENNNSALLANDAINVLNEGWVRYNFESLSLSNTTAHIGRKINNAEVFRSDDFRQKARSIQAFELNSTDMKNHTVTLGHAAKMSSWIQVGDRADFNNFGKVFNGNGAENTDGITWAEIVNRGVKGLEIAAFNAYAYDVANLFGVRAKYSITDTTAILGNYRNETDVGKADTRHSDCFGLAAEQKVGAVKIEAGYFGVHGNDLRFQETTTGINHALGASMMIYAKQFAGGSDTAYLKAVTTLESTKTVLYALYNYTWQDKETWDGQELNFVIKQPVPAVENLTVCFKGGIGYRDAQNGGANTKATDARLFITYAF